MAIEFKCLRCGRPLTADRSSAGLDARCPSCGHIAKIPTPDKTSKTSGQLTTLEDLEADLLASSEDKLAAEPPAPPAVEQSVDLEILAQDDAAEAPGPTQMPIPPSRRISLKRFEQRPSMFPAAPAPPPPSRKNADEPPPPPEEEVYHEVENEPMELAPNAPAGPLPLPEEGVSLGRFVLDCLGAVGFAFGNLANVLMLVLAVGLLSAGIAVGGSVLVVAAEGNVGMKLAVMIASILANMLLLGYCFRYMLDLASTTIEGAQAPPFLPHWNGGELLITFLRMLGIIVVYIIPIITIPLLPLGVLGVAYADDGRGFNVAWAARAAVKRPLQLLMLWLMMGFWLVAIILAVFLVLMIVVFSVGRVETVAGAISLLVGIVLVIACLGVMFGVIQHRCIGLLGRDYPELLNMMPEHPSGSVSLAFVAGGLLVGLLIRGWWGGAVAPLVQAAMQQQSAGSAFDSYIKPKPANEPAVVVAPTPAPAFTPQPQATPGGLLSALPTPAPTAGPSVAPTPAPSPAPDEEALRQQLVANLKKCRQAVVDYAAAHDGKLPFTLNSLISASLLEESDRRNPLTGGSISMEPAVAFNPASDDILASAQERGSFRIITHSGNVEVLSFSQYVERISKQRAAVRAAIPASTTRSIANRPYATSASAPAPAGPVVTWDMPNWPTIQYDRFESNPHPFVEFCQVLKEIRADNFKATAGVEVGPLAKDRTDKAYLDFKAKALERLIAMAAKSKGLGPRKDMVQKFGDIDYDRSFCFQGTMKMASLMTAVEHGRCVAYWFDGNTATFMKLTGGLNKVTARD